MVKRDSFTEGIVAYNVAERQEAHGSSSITGGIQRLRCGLTSMMDSLRQEINDDDGAGSAMTQTELYDKPRGPEGLFQAAMSIGSPVFFLDSLKQETSGEQERGAKETAALWQAQPCRNPPAFVIQSGKPKSIGNPAA
eukprot:CAMPEP_0116824626 /NCGR_PEP_ID=MMETSP0418-20121206/1501_1 /TAXON_ID=1158023 /ORGANISM="Astrosyne radiata, Strain 13vi08-1A" /LENGTH=137 /DNA_ID=CAMNT_0004453017 /DNA_START=355 /DNA_END=768 /DNA_ORIENTATION=+